MRFSFRWVRSSGLKCVRKYKDPNCCKNKDRCLPLNAQESPRKKLRDISPRVGILATTKLLERVGRSVEDPVVQITLPDGRWCYWRPESGLDCLPLDFRVLAQTHILNKRKNHYA